jgi:hypothetical protein
MINQQLSRFATHENSAYPQLWRGCVGAWCPSLGPSGSRLHDYSRRNNWGTLTNMDPATDWIVDGGGYALNFDNTNNVVITDLNIKELGTKGTLCAWAKFRTLNSGTHAVISLYYGYDYTIISQYGSQIFWYWRTSGNTITAGSLVTNRWYHCCISNDGVTFRAYLDGVQVGSSLQFGSNSAAQIGIGGASFGGWILDGWVDDARVYDRCLHTEEIRTLARRRAIAYEPKYWVPPFPEQAGGGGVTSRLYAWQSARLIGAGR